MESCEFLSSAESSKEARVAIVDWFWGSCATRGVHENQNPLVLYFAIYILSLELGGECGVWGVELLSSQDWEEIQREFVGGFVCELKVLWCVEKERSFCAREERDAGGDWETG